MLLDYTDIFILGRGLSRFTPGEAPVLGSSARSFPHRLLGGRKLRFPPSNRRFAPCLPFADFVLRPKGPSPLEPPLLCLRKSANSLRLGLRSSLLSVEKPCPLSLRRVSSPNTLASSPPAPEPRHPPLFQHRTISDLEMHSLRWDCPPSPLMSNPRFLQRSPDRPVIKVLRSRRSKSPTGH